MKIRVKFAKKGIMCYIGHLDLMRHFHRVIRMMHLPVAYSEGFNPHPIMSFTAPLSLGMTSTGEYLDIKLNYPPGMGERLNLRDVGYTLDNATNRDIQILDIKRIKDDSKASMSSLSAADYYIFPDTDRIKMQNIFHNFEEFMTQNEINIIKEGKGGEKKINFAPFIYESKLYMPGSPGHDKAFEIFNDTWPSKEGNMPVIFIKASAGSAFHVKPYWPVMAYYESRGDFFKKNFFHYHRIEMYADLAQKPKETLEERMHRERELISMNEFEVIK